ncbi:MAG: ATP-binding protein [Methylococcales bacterium]|nr:ATP-binding protein [Methylococcales bacterium]
MYSLNRLILIDSYKPGELVEVRLDGHTNLNGVNGAGKTTLLRLVPLFFGERPGRLVPKSRVTDSFAKHYLPNESSYIIFEYQRHEQTCMALLYASPNEEGLCYRFVDKGFDKDDFIEIRRDGSLYPVSCRGLRTHFLKRHINCSDQITACSDYRTVIQNLPHKKGQELRQLVARYSFCNGSSGHRLKDIEKIVTGMFMRSTDFADLREMLVNCIEENRDSIALELQMETLDSWHKEYRAYQETESERDKIERLNQLENDLLQVELSLGELQYRLQCLSNQNEQALQQEQEAGNACNRQLEQLKNDWEIREQALKSGLAAIMADLEQALRQKITLETEKAEWEKQDVQGKKQLVARLDQIKDSLSREQENHKQLMSDVQDIEAEFKRLKAEKEQYFAAEQHSYEISIKDSQQRAIENKSAANKEVEQRKESLRQASQQQQDNLHIEQLKLQGYLGALTSKIAEIQPDPALIENREAKQGHLTNIQQQKQDAEKTVNAIEAETKKYQALIDAVFSDKRKRAEDKQRIQDAIEQLQKQLDANPDTLLGFLRDHQPDWINNIAKVINPDLLLRDDLEPALQALEHTFYGLTLNLGSLTADPAADEEKIRALLVDGQNQLIQLIVAEAKSDEQLEDLSKIADDLKKRHRAAELNTGQLQKQLNGLVEELSSLKQQIERSRKERKARLEQEKSALEEQIRLSNSRLQSFKQQLEAEIQRLNQELSVKVQQITDNALLEVEQIQQCIDNLNQQKGSELTQLEQQRLQSLQDRKVDTATLIGLETKISQITAEKKAAEQAEQTVKDYQRWLDNEWSRYDGLVGKALDREGKRQQQQNQYEAEKAQTQQRRNTLKEELERINSKLRKFTKEIDAIKKLLADLAAYSKRTHEQVSFDNAHTLSLLQTDYRSLTEQHKTLRNDLAVLVRHLKRVLGRFPGAHPGRYYARVEDELGIDSDEMAWLNRIQAWYDTRFEEARSWLMSQAKLFGSAIRNYQQALERFDRGIDSLSRRLAANIDGNIRFEKIERIEGRLTSKVTTLGYWEQIVSFTRNYDDWSRANDGQLPTQEFADIVRLVSEQLQSKGRVEMKLVNLLELEIIVTENGRSKRATHAEELRQISSHGLSYLILCVFFIALVNMIRKDQPLNIIWPMDELKELHQMNIEVLVETLTKNRITLFSAFPDPDPEVLKLFKNRYQVFGYRELIEMDVDEDYLSALEPLVRVAEHV